jgi:hypothetical protein
MTRKMTKELIDRIFKEPGIKYELSEFETLGNRFRIWATQRLREYIIKGLTLDDDRLKLAKTGIWHEKWWD